MTPLRHALAGIILSLLAQPAWAQITVLDSAQDNVAAPAVEAAPVAPPPPCGTEPVSIARMSWPSAAILAEIHARLLTGEFGCEVRVVPGDLAATASSMGSTGQPQVAPELWINRIADLWNGAMEGQQVRSAAPSYAESQFEGWYMPTALASSFSAPPAAADLAAALGSTGDDAMAALVNALPPEAEGNPEGWVVAGDYGFEDGTSLQAAAAQMTGVMVTQLESEGVPRERWLNTVILASILQQEAPAGPSDQAGVARVIHNRLDAGMPLQIESPLAYYLHADTRLVGDDAWAADTPYNTYMYEGLPPGAIGTPTQESLYSALNPNDGDWLYFLRGADGRVSVYSTIEDFTAGVNELFPGTGMGD